MSGRHRRQWCRTVAVVGLCVTPWLVASCTGGGGDQVSVKEMRENQKQILERLKKIEDTLAALSKPRPAMPPIDYSKVYDIPMGGSPRRGAENGKVTLVEFSDFQCPYSRMAQPIIQQILQAYPKDVVHVFKNYPLPFHQRALPAAKACLAAGEQGKFWELHNVLYEDQKKMEDADIREDAKKLGLDMVRFEQDLKGDKVQKEVDEDLKAVREAEVRGTPTLFLNGRRVQDRSFDALKAEIDRILKGGGGNPS